MVNSKFKIKYELHYWKTNVTGTNEKDVNEVRIKGIYFPTQGVWGEWKYKLAVGAEWIVSANNADIGIGSGSDQIAPLVGLALVKGNTVLVPLIQHFQGYDGPDYSTTSVRLIAIQSLENNYWAKLDAKIPFEWENDNAIPATVEVQLGKMLTSSFGLYADALFGVGGDKPYDWGAGVGVRFNY